MRAYASRTGTKRNLNALDGAGWGLLVSAYGVHRTEGWNDYMLDNGAWSAHTSGKPWDASQFEALLEAFGEGSHQTIAPDIVAGGLESLSRSLSWLPRLPGYVLLAMQDGLSVARVRPYLGGRVGLAVGGSTAWKWRTLSTWCELGRVVGCRVHVLRANSARMIGWAKACGAYSFDGSGPSKFAECLPRMDGGRTRPVQMTMTGLGLPAPFTPRSK